MNTSQGSWDTVTPVPFPPEARLTGHTKEQPCGRISALAMSPKSTSACDPSSLRVGSAAPRPTVPTHRSPGGCACPAGAARRPVGLFLAVPRLSGKCCKPVVRLVSSLRLHGFTHGTRLHPMAPVLRHPPPSPWLQPQLDGVRAAWGRVLMVLPLIWSGHCCCSGPQNTGTVPLLLLRATKHGDNPTAAALAQSSAVQQNRGSACALPGISLNTVT